MSADEQLQCWNKTNYLLLSIKKQEAIIILYWKDKMLIKYSIWSKIFAKIKLQIQYFSISEVFIVVDPCEIRNIDLLSYEKKLLKLELNQNINLYVFTRNSYLVMVSN